MHHDLLKENFIDFKLMNHSQGITCNLSPCHFGVDDKAWLRPVGQAQKPTMI